MTKFITTRLPVSFLVFFLVTVPQLARANAAADLITEGLTKTGGEGGAGYSSIPLEQLIGQIIQVMLSIVGILFLVLTIYAGFLWMTAAGEAKKAQTAKDILRNAAIGLVVVIAAYALTRFVVDALIIASSSS